MTGEEKPNNDNDEEPGLDGNDMLDDVSDSEWRQVGFG